MRAPLGGNAVPLRHVPNMDVAGDARALRSQARAEGETLMLSARSTRPTSSRVRWREGRHRLFEPVHEKIFCVVRNGLRGGTFLLVCRQLTGPGHLHA